MMSDPIADMLTRIRNAQVVGKASLSMRSSNLKVAVAKVLKEEGYIQSFEISGEDKPGLRISLKYFQGRAVIEKIKRVSKPGLRVYKAKDDVLDVMGGLGVSIISTSKGVITNKAARKLGVGGEIICEVY